MLIHDGLIDTNGTKKKGGRFLCRPEALDEEDYFRPLSVASAESLAMN